jgi:hypothetical protein
MNFNNFPVALFPEGWIFYITSKTLYKHLQICFQRKSWRYATLEFVMLFIFRLCIRIAAYFHNVCSQLYVCVCVFARHVPASLFNIDFKFKTRSSVKHVWHVLSFWWAYRKLQFKLTIKTSYWCITSISTGSRYVITKFHISTMFVIIKLRKYFV